MVKHYEYQERVPSVALPNCMECGLPLRLGEERVSDRGRPATSTSPAERPYIAHRECPPQCACGDYGTRQLGKTWVCDDCYPVASVAFGAHQSGVSLSSEFKDGGPPYERKED